MHTLCTDHALNTHRTAHYTLHTAHRFYLLFRGVHFWKGEENAADARILAGLNHLEMNPSLTFR
jgi:hypothetical protein